ncbi:lactam utilization protein LamB [Flavivirga aquatica]|uniref:Lactam utilization protein LamB n=2 Tax=Flavivirga aquatica TaxID=1849968 RepID=A0A1E5TBB5_9FLAO|nr:lactam utilization protein LamB [Flavivirga aquatica]
MPHISSCNIACGGHAGDLETMKAVVKLAKQNRVKIGAHPSFPDKENFGRVKMSMSCAALFTSLKQQVDDLLKVLNNENARLHHIKPHGALYNLAMVDEKIANVIVEIVKSFVLPIKLYVPFNSLIAQVAIENNIPVIYEAFADRNYNDDLTLVSRKDKEAIIDDEVDMFNHVYNIIMNQKVKTINNVSIAIKADTYCVHGDHPETLNLLKTLRHKLEDKGIKII